jgi:hypothetical protein
LRRDQVLPSVILGFMPARNRNLPRHLAWPLTTTDIGGALGPRMAHVSKLWFRAEPTADGTLLRVEWVPATVSNYGMGSSKPAYMLGLQIRVSPLKAVDRAAARAVLRQVALPELDTWICHALQASESWLQVRHDRCWQLTDGRLTRHEEQ